MKLFRLLLIVAVTFVVFTGTGCNEYDPDRPYDGDQGPL